MTDLTLNFRSLQKLEELEKEEELREAAGLYDSEPVSDTDCVIGHDVQVDIPRIVIANMCLYRVCIIIRQLVFVLELCGTLYM